MDETVEPSSDLSLIPYLSDAREVVLRHGSSIVLYDERSQQISIRDTQNLSSRGVEEANKCPWCHRPLQHHHEAGSSDGADAPVDEASFVNPSYFRMLHHSREGSHHSSRDASPKRLALHTDGRSRPESAPTSALRQTAEEAHARNISTQAFSQGYFKAFFREEGELGRGGKGVVFLVKHVLEGVSLGYFACKRVPVGDNAEWLKKVLVEVQLLQNLSHQNLVSYKHVWLEDVQITTFGPSVPCAFILQQFCDAGDLQRYVLRFTESRPSKEELKDRARRASKASDDLKLETPKLVPMQFEEIFSFFKDITMGLNHLHAKYLIHRDLKPSNCLLQRDGERIRVLLSDFGEMQGINVMRHGTGATGTISWSAPEVVRPERLGNILGNFTTKSDIFSLGLILHFMCFATLPYGNADSIDEDKEDIDKLRAEISSWTGMDDARRDRNDLPDRLYKVLKILLAADPDKRPTTEDLLQTLRAGSAFADANTWHAGPSAHQGPESPTRTTSFDPASPHFGQPPETEKRSSRFGGRRMDRKNSASSVSSVSKRPVSASTSPGPPRDETKSSLVLRKMPLDSSEARQPVQSPRLLGPPTPIRNRLLPARPSRPELVAWTQILLFCFKAYLCLTPCSPLAANLSFVIPLLAVGALDMAGLVRGPIWSALALMLHVVAVIFARRFNVLCAVGVPQWEEPASQSPP